MSAGLRHLEAGRGRRICFQGAPPVLGEVMLDVGGRPRFLPGDLATGLSALTTGQPAPQGGRARRPEAERDVLSAVPWGYAPPCPLVIHVSTARREERSPARDSRAAAAAGSRPSGEGQWRGARSRVGVGLQEEAGVGAWSPHWGAAPRGLCVVAPPGFCPLAWHLDGSQCMNYRRRNGVWIGKCTLILLYVL